MSDYVTSRVGVASNQCLQVAEPHKTLIAPCARHEYGAPAKIQA